MLHVYVDIILLIVFPYFYRFRATWTKDAVVSNLNERKLQTFTRCVSSLLLWL